MQGPCPNRAALACRLAAEADVSLIVVDLMQIWRTINHDHETGRFTGPKRSQRSG
jgi:hypothetical protein